MAKRTKKASGEQNDALSFEEALARLEAVVAELEDGELQLEASLRIFEEGVRLSRQCAAQLDVAEQRVEVLTREGDAWQAQPLQDFDGADEELGG